jgi:starch synthase
MLSGILNGIDEKEWNPATDAFLPVNYSAETVDQGKPAAKEALQEDLGLPRRVGVPLIGMVGRMSEQKGVDMVAELIPEWMERSDVQWAILGRGDPKYHRIFERFSKLYPERLAVRLEHSEVLAHRIEAGADLFLMPSRFEPCGLNQMYSLKYGTVPVVRETGGLADTIVDATPANLAAGTANGFSFREDNVQALGETLRRAYDACHQPEVSRQLIATGMKQDWSWARSAAQYASLYQQTVQRMKQAGGRDGAV